MGGVYGGSMLAYFPELLADYDILAFAPKIGAGLVGKKVILRVNGYFSRNKGGKEAVVSELRTENQQANFWCEDEVPSVIIRQGAYIEDSGELYQFVLDNAYVREGGFVRHTMQMVVGNTDRQAPHPAVNLGMDEYK